MQKLVLLLTICLFAIPISLAVFLSLAIEAKPRIVRQVTLSPEHIERAKKIIDTHRYRTRPGMLATIRILSGDADIAANYLLNRLAKGNVRVSLSDRRAFIRLSLPVPENIINGYLNFEVKLAQTTGYPQLQSARIGNIALPDFVTDILVSQCFYWLQRIPEFRSGIEAVQRVHMSQNEVNIIYRWNGRFSQETNGISFIDEQEQARLLQYQSLLVENSQQYDSRIIPLSVVLPPLMHLAAKRSTNGAAIAENRAMILVTTFYVLGMPLKRLIPQASKWPHPVRRVVTLDGRDDLAKHFMVSAAITAYADTILSDAIGLYKEIEDSRSGSGFSFNDIAADRAGTRFGEKAVANQASAQRLQQLVTVRLRDADLMPAWSDLPEFMHEAEFKKRFGGIDAPAYKKMMNKIEHRISMLRVLH